MSHQFKLSGHAEEASFALLAEALAPIEPTVEVREGLRQRILKQIKPSPAPELRSVLNDGSGWSVFAPKVEIKILRQDAQTTTALLRLEPQAVLPDHGHDEEEECFVIEGEIVLGGRLLRAGDFQLARMGSIHADSYTPTGCIMLVRAATAAYSQLSAPGAAA